jgi:tRNA dimethylallyltransferase
VADIAVLVGPTASGKSAVAMQLARRLGDVELVSMDSMVVYRHMDIGTAKPTAGERAEVPHHLIDLVDPDAEWTVADHQAACTVVLADIAARGHRALLVGGTGLYVQAVVDGLDIPGRFAAVRAELDAEPDTAVLHQRLVELDPLAASRMEPTNRRRVVRALEVTVGSGRPFSSYGPGLDRYPSQPWPMVGLDVPRRVLDERISERYRQQMDAGLLAEVAALAGRQAGLSRTARQALGYRELLDHVEHGRDLDDALDEAVTRTRQFSRRQQRWFRRDPRITWLAADDPDDPGLVQQFAGLVGW